MTVVDKRINQPVIEHHGNKVKLEQYFTRTKAHRRAMCHDGAHSTVMLPAVRKKGDERRFPVKSSDQSWLAGCARNKWSYDSFAATAKTLQ